MIKCERWPILVCRDGREAGLRSPLQYVDGTMSPHLEAEKTILP